MKIIFFAENHNDIYIINKFIEKNSISNYLIMPICNKDPHFYDCFTNEKLFNWNNKDFIETRNYKWIIDYKENANIFKKLLDDKLTEKPYFNSLIFYLAQRYGNEYTVFVFMLIEFFKEHNISKYYTKNNNAIYINYLEETKLFLDIKSSYYE